MKAFWTLGVASMVLCASGVFAQVAPTQPPVARGGQAASTSQATRADHEIFACKLTEGRNEIELAKLAQQKSQNEQVKQFAAKMIKEHEAAAAKIEKFVGETAHPAVRGEGRVETPRETGAATTAGAARQPGGLNWVAIHQQIAEKCLASAKKELGQKEGAEFDKCYMGMQVGVHQKMVDADEVFASYVSPEGRELVDECMKTANEHLREAKDILKTIEGKPAARTAGRAE